MAIVIHYFYTVDIKINTLIITTIQKQKKNKTKNADLLYQNHLIKIKLTNE